MLRLFAVLLIIILAVPALRWFLAKNKKPLLRGLVLGIFIPEKYRHSLVVLPAMPIFLFQWWM
jgi:hypothetical protein